MLNVWKAGVGVGQAIKRIEKITARDKRGNKSMKHYGNITEIKGKNVEVVDIVTGGSPCQDLSVAGKREGLQGERSGLFMEQIRIVKEMREIDRATGRTDEFIRPRFMVWENVYGALSSNKGEDFRTVLEEIAKIADGNAVVPRPSKKWSKSGCILGDGWSIAWRVHDAQFWGVPQRRKRIALVADFGGATAPEILFERKSVSRDIAESGEAGKDADSPRYKALGNSIALPFWQWLAYRIVKQYDRPTTMASLFDGIGGFPLVFSRCNCTPLWASEIEEFPIAVTKIRFNEEEDRA